MCALDFSGVVRVQRAPGYPEGGSELSDTKQQRVH